MFFRAFLTPPAWFSHLSLRSRFTLLIAVLVFATTLLLAWCASRESARQIEAGIGAAAADAAYQMTDKLNRSMNARIKEVKLLLSLQMLDDTSDVDVLQRQMERLQATYSVASWVGRTNDEGVVVAATGGILEGTSIAQRPVFTEGRQGFWLGDVHEALLLSSLLPTPSGEPLKFVDIAAPIHDQRGRFTGVLAVHLSWQWAEYIQRSMQPPGHRGNEMEMLLLAADNTVLLGPREMRGQKLDGLRALPPLDSTHPRWAVEVWPDGQRYVTGYARSAGFEEFEGLGWLSLSRQPVETAFAGAQRLRWAIMSIGLLLAVVFATLGWWLASGLVAPLARLSRAADAIRDGAGAEAIPLEGGAPELKRLSTSLRDMVVRLSDQRQTITRLEDLANTDPLTGLPNRAFLDQYLQHAMPEAQRNGQSMVVMYIDLDGFKCVNDELGHYAGDLLLIEITYRLKNALRSGDVVARLGGDEFVMVLKTPPDYLERLTHEVGRRLLSAIERPIALPEERQAHVGCSLGAAWWPQHGEHIEAVFKLADGALYTAKSQGKHRLIIHRPPR